MRLNKVAGFALVCMASHPPSTSLHLHVDDMTFQKLSFYMSAPMHVTTFHQQHMQDYAIYMTLAYYQLYKLYFNNFFSVNFKEILEARKLLLYPLPFSCTKKGHKTAQKPIFTVGEKRLTLIFWSQKWFKITSV